MDTVRTIRVNGSGRLMMKPDLMRLRVTVNGLRKEYDEAVKGSAEKTNEVRELLKGFGFDGSELKTAGFDVRAEYTDYEDKNGRRQRRFKGYRFEHRMKLEFPADNTLLGRLLYAMAHSSAKPELDIEYTVSDRESCRNELLAKAVKDSRAKAAAMAEAAGAELGAVMEIDCCGEEHGFSSRSRNFPMLMDCCAMDADKGACALDMEAEDIVEEEEVSVVWSIA